MDGILFDLGVSSMQLDRADRGFAYSVDAPLDMRMNSEDPLTAADVLNTYSHGDLARILQRYGEERFAGKIASAVLREREKEPSPPAGGSWNCCTPTIPAPARRTGGHPAKRTFQALRIEVNAELASLEAAVPAGPRRARPGRPRWCSSATNRWRTASSRPSSPPRTRSTTPAGLPMDLPGTAATFELLTRGAERATDAGDRREPARRSRPAAGGPPAADRTPAPSNQERAMTAPNATTAPGSTRARRAPGRRDDRDTARPRSGSAQRALDRRQKRLAAQEAVLAAGGTRGRPRRSARCASTGTGPRRPTC